MDSKKVQLQLSRREVMRILGIGTGLAGLGTSIACTGPSTSSETTTTTPTNGTPPISADIAFPEGAVIRTMQDDLDPTVLAGGATLFHEHLDLFQGYASPPSTRGRDAPPMTDEEAAVFVDLVIEELKMAAADGMSCIVDAAIHRRGERELGFLREMAARSGVPIIMAGSYWKAPYPPDIASMTAEEWTDHMITDAHDQGWGAFGEVGTSMEMHETERTFLQAVSRAHLATGLPIFTHTEHQGCRPCGLEQMDVFDSENIDPSHLCIGHQSDITPEQDPGWTTHLEIVRRGAYIGFDTVGRALALPSSPDIPETEKVKMVLNVLEAGYEDQILLSADFASSVDLKSNWGNGFATTLIQFVPKLRHAGVDEATIHKITVDNPRRFLAFVPPSV